MRETRFLLIPGLGLALSALVLAACGKRGDPLPPLRRTPQVVGELALAQRGSDFEIRIQAPRTTTEGERLGVLTLEILKATGEEELGKSSEKREVKAAPGERIVVTEALPAPGTVVRVAVIAHSGKRASSQSPAHVLKVADAVPPPHDLVAEMQADGVHLAFTAPDPMPAWIEPPKPVPSAKGGHGKPGTKGGEATGPSGEEEGATTPAFPPPSTSVPSAAPTPTPTPAPTPTPGPAETAPAPTLAPEEGSSAPPAAEEGTPATEQPAVAPTVPSPTTGGPTPEPSPTPIPKVSGFHLYRRQDPGSYGAPLNTELATQTASIDAEAPIGTAACYVVRTVVSSEPLIESEASNEVCVDVRDVKPPAAPSGVTTLPGDSGVEISWSPSSEPDLAAYRVYRQAGRNKGERVAEVKPPQTSFVDADAGAGRVQYYVTAVDAAGNESPPSAKVEGGHR